MSGGPTFILFKHDIWQAGRVAESMQNPTKHIKAVVMRTILVWFSEMLRANNVECFLRYLAFCISESGRRST